MNKTSNELRVKNQGFTLVELLVTIAIIGTLTAILLPNFMGARERARDAQKIQDLSSIKNALRMYYNDFQSYPTPASGMVGVGLSTYLPAIVNIGFSYSYTVGSNNDSFVLRTNLESGVAGQSTESFQKCGLVPTPNQYAVCGN